MPVLTTAFNYALQFGQKLISLADQIARPMTLFSFVAIACTLSMFAIYDASTTWSKSVWPVLITAILIVDMICVLLWGRERIRIDPRAFDWRKKDS